MIKNFISRHAAKKRKESSARRIEFFGIFDKKHKNFLRDVFGNGGFLRHSKSETVNRIAQQKINLAEGVAVAGGGSFYQILFDFPFQNLFPIKKRFCFAADYFL
jgi:hypothetical protein